MSEARETEWPVTWEAERREQVLAVAALPLERRLAWLEEALKLAMDCGALAKTRKREEDSLRALYSP